MEEGTARDGELGSNCLVLPSLSVIIPAFNEEACLPDTLRRLRVAEERLTANGGTAIQILVVDNGSTDRTGEVAQRAGATVVREARRNIASVRNAGAAAAGHDVLMFLDADTSVPAELLRSIVKVMRDPGCAGGCVDVLHQPGNVLLKAHFAAWRALGLLLGTAQGACQFCRRSMFRDLGGYDETWYMGEDLDFYWRLKRLARRRGWRTAFIREYQVVPSPRRWKAWPIWQTLIRTNPLVCFALRRRKAAWPGWYRDPPR